MTNVSRMAQRAALRLDEQAERDLAYLASKFGTQTAAVKSALAVLAHRERLRDRMQALVDEVEADSGPLTEEELAKARRHYDESGSYSQQLERATPSTPNSLYWLDD